MSVRGSRFGLLVSTFLGGLLIVGSGSATAGVDGPEVGANDFRISDMGPDGTAAFGAFDPSVAFNPATGEFLVVWRGDDDSGSLVDGEFEIFAQRVDAVTGDPIGDDFRISDMGPDGTAAFGAFDPSVAFNPATGEFLVVWRGDDDSGSLVDGEFEVFGQRVDGGGVEVGVNDFRISDMGSDGNLAFGAFEPSIAFNPATGEFLVVWEGDDDSGSLIDGEFEVFGQRLDGGGVEVGVNDFRISDMGPDGNPFFFGAFAPSVAFNRVTGEFLVVWLGDDDTGSLVNNEFEIFAQRLDGAGVEVGVNDFRISDMGPDGNRAFAALDPSVAFNPVTGEFLVVWLGDDDTGSLVNNEFEIFAQRLDGAGGEVGANDFRISDMGPDGGGTYGALGPAVAFNPATGEFLVVWSGDDDTGSLVNNEFEVFAQRVDGGGGEVGVNDFRISDMGPDSDTSYAALSPAVVSNSAGNEYFVVWSGDDNTGSLADNESEIFGQRLRFGTPHDVGLVDTSTGEWRLRDHRDGSVTSFTFGNPGDRPLVGDWDGDGVETPGLFRDTDGFFYGRNSNDTGIADFSCFGGNPSDVALGGDWDGDGVDTLGIYRPSEQMFYLFNSPCVGNPGPGMGAADVSFLFGNPGDTPAVGDWDGDGMDEIGLYRESAGFFYWRDTLDTGIASDEMFFGDPGDLFVAGDWGLVDGVDTPAVFRGSVTTFFFRHTLTQGNADSQFSFGESGWSPVAGIFGLD